jgi:hypothetical protein
VSARCSDRDAALRGDDPALAAAWRQHAGGCAECAEELAFWDELSAAALSLRREWSTPGLRGKILSTLAEEGGRGRRLASWEWLTAAAAAALVAALGIRAFAPGRGAVPSPRAAASAPAIDAARQRFLTEQAVADVEQAEAAYLRSIEALSRVAEPHLQEARSPLVENYREKLLLLDAAIAACRAEVEGNRFNAHLRQELLSVYREKQRTLQSLLKEDPHAL